MKALTKTTDIQPGWTRRIIRLLPFFGKMLRRYERALIQIGDENCIQRHEIEEGLDDEVWWKMRRRNIGTTESMDGDEAQIAWKDFPYA